MEKQHNSNNFVLSAKAGETEWKNNAIQTTLHFLQKLERQNGKTTQFRQLCTLTFCKSWRDGMEKQHNSNNFVLSAKAGETEWKNNAIQTTLYFLQKLERQNGKTTQFKQLCTFCKSWRDGMEKQHNSDNFVLSAKAGETEWKNNTIQTTLYFNFLQKLERWNGKTTQFKQLCTFCKSWRDGMEKQRNSDNFALSAKAGETEWKNNTIQTTLYFNFLQKLERWNGKTTQFKQLCTFCKSWRDRMEKQRNSDNFVLSAKAGEMEWKNNTIQTTLYFLQKLERRNGKTTQFRQLCTFCKSWRDRMEKQHNSDNFVL